MAHELAFFTDGRARMAYAGDTPWHGLGQNLTVGAPIEVWAKQAGMDFEILGTPVTFKAASGKTYAQGSKQVLYRKDTDEPLGVVGNKYKVVQPIQILEFFRNLVADAGFQLETAGVLFNGAKYWALAQTGNEAKIKGDHIKQYLMLATACDGTLRTTAKMVETRVVCNNTLTMANAEAASGIIKVSHSTTFDAGKVQSELGLFDDAWKAHVQQVKALADCKVSAEQAIKFVAKLFGDVNRPIEDNKGIPAVGKVLGLFDGYGLGSDMKSAANTAWGLVNATSEYLQWHIGKNQDRRLESAWFYQNANLAQTAFNDALALAAA